MDAAKLSALHDALESFDAQTLDRGFDYFDAEHLSLIEITTASISCVSKGSSLYDTIWRYHRGAWSSECSCPVGMDCKHSAALAMAAIARLESAAAEESPPKSARPPAATPATLGAHLEATLGRKLRQTEQKRVRHLLALHAELRTRSQNTVYDDELARVGISTGRREPSWIQGPAFADWWGTPPATPLDLWQYLAFYAEEHDLKIPPLFRPVTETSGVREALEKRLLDASIAEWEQNLADFAPPIGPPATARTQRLRLRLDANRIRWEQSFLPDQWRALNAQEVRSLAEGGTDEDDDSVSLRDPAAILLLEFARRIHGPFDYQRTNYALSLDRDEDAALLGSALRHPLTRPSVVNRSGDPLGIAAEALHWTLRADDSAPDQRLVATLVEPSGRPVEGGTLLPGKQALLLLGEMAHRLPPPLDPDAKAPYGPTRIPREALVRNPRAAAALVAAGADLPADLVPRVRALALAPRLEFELTGPPNSPHSRDLRVKLLATHDDVQLAWCGRDGWLADGKTPPATDADGTVRDYAIAAADELIDHLAALGLGYYEREDCWGRAFTRKAADRLLDWAQGLPAGLDIRASQDLAPFFAPVVRVTAEFHIEENPNSPDWFDLRVQLAAGEIELTPAELKELARSGGKLVQLKSGRWIRAEFQSDPALEETARRLGLGDLDSLGGETVTCHALQLAAQPLDHLLDERAAARLRRRADEITAHPPPPIPADLRADLRPYQRDGFAFLAFLARNGFGGILADDMGLGKTVQGLAWLLWLRSRLPEPDAFRVLVVCPKSVVFNWSTERDRFAPTLPGRSFAPAATTAGAEPGLTVANYAQLRLNADWFTAQRWDALILDEGQNIKNPTATTTRTACSLLAPHRIILTGTPVENRPLDLWSLFQFAQPGLLGSQASFRRIYENATTVEPLQRLQARVRHFMLRRTKTQVAPDLPARIEEDILVELDGPQLALYRAELKRARQLALGIESKSDFDQARFNVLQSLLRLRQICCDPRLGAKGNATAKPGAKIAQLLEQIEPILSEGHRVLVFSQFVEMLGFIGEALRDRGIDHLQLTGQTNDRQALVERFQSADGPPVFLLSLKAAGAGLNLTAASYVVLFDPWWNPAVEAQAIDRTHRIGQAKTVIAYRLIAKDTIEEKIRALQNAKAEVANAIVLEESLAKVLDLDSLRYLLAE